MRRTFAVGALVLVLLTMVSQAAQASHGGIPRRVIAILRARALRTAAAEGDRHPYDIEAVRTTIANAERATGSHEKEFYLPPDTPIYLIAMRGHFSCNSCSPPAGGNVGPGTVITLETSVEKPAQVRGFSFGRRYPDLKIAGTPIRL